MLLKCTLCNWNVFYILYFKGYPVRNYVIVASFQLPWHRKYDNNVVESHKINNKPTKLICIIIFHDNVIHFVGIIAFSLLCFGCFCFIWPPFPTCKSFNWHSSNRTHIHIHTSTIKIWMLFLVNKANWKKEILTNKNKKRSEMSTCNTNDSEMFSFLMEIF